MLHALSAQEKLQSFDSLTIRNWLQHSGFIILVEPQPFVFLLNVLKFDSDAAHIRLFKVCFYVADLRAVVLELLCNSVVEGILVQSVVLV